MNQKRINKIEKLRDKVQMAVNKYQDTIQDLEVKIDSVLNELTDKEKEFLNYYSLEDVTQDIIVLN